MKQNTALGKLGRLLFGVFFLFLSLFLLYEEYYQQRQYIFQALSGGFENYEDVLNNTSGNLNEGYYSLKIDGCLGCFGTMSEGSSVKDYYYVVWLADDSFAAIKVDKEKDAKALDEIETVTWAYINGESTKLTDTPLELSVLAKSIYSEDRQVSEGYIDYLEQVDITQDRYTIRTTMLEVENMAYFWVEKVLLFAVCVIMVFVGIATILGSFVQWIREKSGIKPKINIDSIGDNRDKQVSHIRAFSRINSDRLKKNLRKLRLEGIAAFGLFAVIIGYVTFCVYHKGEDNFFVNYMNDNSYLVTVALVISLVLCIGAIVNHYTFIDNLRFFADVDFDRIEDEIDRNSARLYPHNLYLTDSFIIKLHANRFGGSTGKNDVDTFFVKYTDIEWVYPSIIGFEQAKIKDNIGVAIYGKEIGKKVIIRLSGSESDKKYVDDIIYQITLRNPRVKVGYTEENQQKFMAG